MILALINFNNYFLKLNLVSGILFSDYGLAQDSFGLISEIL